jgi:hypothetical protein
MRSDAEGPAVGYSRSPRNKSPSGSGSHQCEYCSSLLQIATSPSSLTTHVVFSHTVREAREACLHGCNTFIELYSNYCNRSVWRLLKTHLHGDCKCCDTNTQRIWHVLKSLSRRPFTLILVAHRDNWRPEPTLLSFAYLDGGDGARGTRYNAYTYAGIHPPFLVHLYFEADMLNRGPSSIHSASA